MWPPLWTRCAQGSRHLPSEALEKLRQGHTQRYGHEHKHTFIHIHGHPHVALQNGLIPCGFLPDCFPSSEEHIMECVCGGGNCSETTPSWVIGRTDKVQDRGEVDWCPTPFYLSTFPRSPVFHLRMLVQAEELQRSQVSKVR